MNRNATYDFQKITEYKDQLFMVIKNFKINPSIYKYLQVNVNLSEPSLNYNVADEEDEEEELVEVELVSFIYIFFLLKIPYF